jgi:hypothetical protein
MFACFSSRLVATDVQGETTELITEIENRFAIEIHNYGLPYQILNGENCIDNVYCICGSASR